MNKIIATISLAAMLSACAPNYSDGFREGVVQKASYKGLIVKSFEGELVTQGFTARQVGQHMRMGNVWTFSATDKKIADQLSEAASTGKPVKLYYTQWFIKPPFSQDTRYNITKLEYVNE